MRLAQVNLGGTGGSPTCVPSSTTEAHWQGRLAGGAFPGHVDHATVDSVQQSQPAPEIPPGCVHAPRANSGTQTEWLNRLSP
eukprot:4444985-Lingulodinium_polyedra.AAC.1